MLDRAIHLDEGMARIRSRRTLMVAMDGMGIAHISELVAAPALASGKLVAVLREYMVEREAIWLLWPPGRERLPKLRAFIDFVSPLFR